MLAAGAWWFAGWEDRGLVRRLGWGGFRLAAKELAFAQAELSTQVFEFALEFGESCASALMHGLPVTGLLAEFEVLGAERAGLARWPRRGRRHALKSRRGRTRRRCKIHTTSMNSTQLQGEVSRKTRTCLPKSYFPGALSRLLLQAVW